MGLGLRVYIDGFRVQGAGFRGYKARGHQTSEGSAPGGSDVVKFVCWGQGLPQFKQQSR